MGNDFRQSSVVSFESRRAADMRALIERCGGKPISAPTLREVPRASHTEALHFTDQLLRGQIDVVILLTGVGTHMLSEIAASQHPIASFIQALGSVVTVARGPKPAAVLRRMHIQPTILVEQPNTWQDVLASLDVQHPVSGQRVAVQEYGQSNTQLLDALKQRGADVLAVPIYRWQLPEDIAPIERAIDAMLRGEVDYALFTSATQLHHLYQVAQKQRNEEKLRQAFGRICIGSIGPITSQAVVELGMTVDYEPDFPHMSSLVHQMARCGNDLLHKKRIAARNHIDTNNWKRIDMIWSPPDQTAGPAPTIADSVFLKACRRQATPYTPVWIMRQIGRYQRAYRDMKKNLSFLELCKRPQLCAEVTLMAVDRLGVDAAIIMADILPVVELLGLHLEYVKGDGPVIHHPVRSAQDVARLQRPNIQEMDYMFEAIKITRRALRPDIALIGFSGAPFTVASYIIEGGKSNSYMHTKTMMYNDPTTWEALMQRLTDLLIEYLNAQITAGADAVQIFDSWVGALCPDDYRRYVLPHVKRLIREVDRSVPLIHFATGNPALLPLFKEAGGDVIGLDWRVDLAGAWKILGDDVAVMGNLDPVVLYASPTVIRNHVKTILDKAAGRPGHIFNLGHGILPSMSPEHVAHLVDAVHELSAKPCA